MNHFDDLPTEKHSAFEFPVFVPSPPAPARNAPSSSRRAPPPLPAWFVLSMGFGGGITLMCLVIIAWGWPVLIRGRAPVSSPPLAEAAQPIVAAERPAVADAASPVPEIVPVAADSAVPDAPQSEGSARELDPPAPPDVSPLRETTDRSLRTPSRRPRPMADAVPPPQTAADTSRLVGLLRERFARAQISAVADGTYDVLLVRTADPDDLETYAANPEFGVGYAAGKAFVDAREFVARTRVPVRNLIVRVPDIGELVFFMPACPSVGVTGLVACIRPAAQPELARR